MIWHILAIVFGALAAICPSWCSNLVLGALEIAEIIYVREQHAK